MLSSAEAIETITRTDGLTNIKKTFRHFEWICEGWTNLYREVYATKSITRTDSNYKI